MMEQSRYGVKAVYRYTAAEHVFYEESVLYIQAPSFEAACDKAEHYAQSVCGTWQNVRGETVRQELVELSSYFEIYPGDGADGVLEVFSRITQGTPDLPAQLLSECTREEMLPLRRWADPEHPEEFD